MANENLETSRSNASSATKRPHRSRKAAPRRAAKKARQAKSASARVATSGARNGNTLEQITSSFDRVLQQGKQLDIAELMHVNPVVLGAVGLGIGMAIGFMQHRRGAPKAVARHR